MRICFINLPYQLLFFLTRVLVHSNWALAIHSLIVHPYAYTDNLILKLRTLACFILPLSLYFFLSYHLNTFMVNYVLGGPFYNYRHENFTRQCRHYSKFGSQRNRIKKTFHEAQKPPFERRSKVLSSPFTFSLILKDKKNNTRSYDILHYYYTYLSKWYKNAKTNGIRKKKHSQLCDFLLFNLWIALNVNKFFFLKFYFAKLRSGSQHVLQSTHYSVLPSQF